MSRLYASPMRVYLCLGALALAGILSGLQLPVSLFPNSSKPRFAVQVGYGDSAAEEFLNDHGAFFEGRLKAISTGEVEVEQVMADYGASSATYRVIFKWGSAQQAARRELEAVSNSFAARLPALARDSVEVQSWNENSGFLALSFYSATQSLDELYRVLDPLLVPRLAQVKDASGAALWNPASREIRVELDPGRMASLRLFPQDVARAIEWSLGGQYSGSVTVNTQKYSIQMPRATRDLEDLGHVLVPTPSGPAVHLSDVARIDLRPSAANERLFKTSGVASLILFATPREGGNVKRMAEEILEAVKAVEPSFPEGVRYKVLVDPSEFIRNSIHNVFHEVGIGALLAVAVLFLFIGSFRNTVTAAIEIPLSMVLAFILMRLSGMNLNLISLGGLALSAGMNVDASVVVMENIFRCFEELPPGTPLSFEQKLRIITRAVREVRFAVIASTVASLVVFLPLAFTSGLSYAVLGDLAKTVVFSHGFSAFVALILVPTVRLQLMSRGKESGVPRPAHSPIEGGIRALESLYCRALGRFVASRGAQWALYAGSAAALALLVALVLPRLPKEILGTPDTDWMMLGVNTKGNTLIRQMEAASDEVEARLLDKVGGRVQYTFTQIGGPNSSTIMARLKDKKQMRAFWKELEAEFSDTPLLRFWVAPWNPAELPIPDPPQLRINVRGGSPEDRAEAARQLQVLMEENHMFPRLWTEPEVGRLQSVVLRPNVDQWIALRSSGAAFGPGDLADLARTATEGRKAGTLTLDSTSVPIYLRYPDGTVTSSEDLGALPVGVGSKIVPFKALSRVSIEDVPPTISREDGYELARILGRKNEGDDNARVAAARKKAAELLKEWQARQAAQPSDGKARPTAYLDDAEKDLHDALRQLAVAVALSVALIFLTLLLQFGSLVNAALVLVAVPLGFIGVLLSLFVFGSTLSLNSVLGVILLNGIAVANSIILVDFIRRLVEQGMDPAQAAVEAGKRRLRPILITSLTTILGMLPIAVGMGDGGRILQPLGIAVSGGLWVSMGLTLFVVPALQVGYLRRLSRRAFARKKFERPEAPPASLEQTVAFVSGAYVADEVAAEGAARRDLSFHTTPVPGTGAHPPAGGLQ